MNSVLDASALLALLHNEKGVDNMLQVHITGSYSV